jgi:tetratricopeptide (TPR) repeat protein
VDIDRIIEEIEQHLGVVRYDLAISRLDEIDQELLNEEERLKLLILRVKINRLKFFDFNVTIDDDSFDRIQLLLDDESIGKAVVEFAYVPTYAGDVKRSVIICNDFEEFIGRLSTQETIATFYNVKALVEAKLGNINNCVDYYLKSLTIRETEDNELLISGSHYNLAKFYLELNKLDKSLFHIEKSIELIRKYDHPVYSAYFHLNYLQVLLSRDEKSKASQIVEDIQSIYTNHIDIVSIHVINILAQATYLNESRRLGDKMRALGLVTEIAYVELKNDSIKIETLELYCRLLILELTTLGDAEVLAELRKAMDCLLEIGKRENSILTITQNLVLSSKIELIEGEVSQAKETLEQAYRNTIEYDLPLLSDQVEKEINLLEIKLKEWKEIVSRSSTIMERLEMVDIKNYLDHAIRLIQDP